MVTIIIFGVGIVVVMSTITSNIGRLYDIREKDTAVSIAKEWIDMVYHVRDSNIERNLFWNCAEIDLAEPSTCGEYFYDDADKYFSISISLTGTYTMNVLTGTGDVSSTIWYHTWVLYDTTWGASWAVLSGFWYDHTSNWGYETIYSRWITFRSVDWYESNTGSILEVTSHVWYNRWWSRDGNVVLQSFIGDIR